jgi:hypothetical protein
VHISPATYLFTSHGQVHIENTITIKATTPFGECHITVPPQTVGTVAYSNAPGGKIKLTPNVSGIKYSTTNSFLCGAAGENGTYKGSSEVGVEGGSLTFDP